MRVTLLLILLSFPAVAGNRATRRALEDAQEAVDDSDADCARKLGRKLAKLDDDGRPARRDVSDVIEFAEASCPRKLASKVRRALAPLTARETRDDDEEEDDDERPSRRDPRPQRSLTMDAVAFQGLLDALRSNGNEYTRLDVLRSAIANQRLTAAQLGPILDAFQNEYLKLDAAKAVVPRLVNPPHALGHAARFRNTFLAADFTKLLSTR